MKKLFSLFAAVLMAGNMMAGEYMISFSEPAAAGTLDGKTFGEGFTLTITDTGSKCQIDKNASDFGSTSEHAIPMNYRLKTGGKSSSKNMMQLVVPEAGHLMVMARTGSGSATDRNIVITDAEGTEVLNHILLDSDTVPGAESKIYLPLGAEVKAGTYTITYPVGAINLYALALEGDSGPEPAIDYYLVGSFNNWNLETALPMDGDTIVTHWDAGTYTFKVITPVIISGEDIEWLTALGYSKVDPEASSECIEADDESVKVTLINDGDVKIQVLCGYLCIRGDFCPTGIDGIDYAERDGGVRKTIENGQLVIIKDGKRYNIVGVKL